MSPAFNEPAVFWIIHLYLSGKLDIYNRPVLKNAGFLCYFYKSDRLRGLFCVFGLMGLQVTAPNGLLAWTREKQKRFMAKHFNLKRKFYPKSWFELFSEFFCCAKLWHSSSLWTTFLSSGDGYFSPVVKLDLSMDFIPGLLKRS